MKSAPRPFSRVCLYFSALGAITFNRASGLIAFARNKQTVKGRILLHARGAAREMDLLLLYAIIFMRARALSCVIVIIRNKRASR
jgi:hypothetical protein